MRRPTAKILAMSGLAALAAFSAMAAQSFDTKGWKRYCNARFGQCVSVPPGLTAEPPPENDDGQIFTAGDGFSLTVSAIYNVLNDTLASEKGSTLEGFSAKPSYEAKGPDWFVVSGVDKGEVYYIKRYVHKDVMSGIHISYPVALKGKYDPLTAAIVRTFKPSK